MRDAWAPATDTMFRRFLTPGSRGRLGLSGDLEIFFSRFVTVCDGVTWILGELLFFFFFERILGKLRVTSQNVVLLRLHIPP